MSCAAIKIEGLSKQYRLGVVGTGTLSHDLNRWWARLRGHSDPTLKVTETNDRSTNGTSPYVWALENIDLDIAEGDVVGIIGRNGAGKSTLLKLISRITTPTTGRICARGRIGSLLEVGTGFHPELTGRENVFLNGAILGMSKREVRRKLDEIIQFSGTSRYIDTPVKRYSSGMRVRLAFAVAAHLEPEILVVDEVLAVGDLEFQKQAIGKMRDVSRSQGRTILFVSHNMSSIKSLCKTGVVLDKGQVRFTGTACEAIEVYVRTRHAGGTDLKSLPRSYSTGEAWFTDCCVVDRKDRKTNQLLFAEPLCVRLTLEVRQPIPAACVDCLVQSVDEVDIIHATSSQSGRPFALEPGRYHVEIGLANRLVPGDYAVTIGLHHWRDGITIDYVESVCPFEVLSVGVTPETGYALTTRFGYLIEDGRFNVHKLSAA